MRDSPSMVGVFFLAVVCCALPLLLLGGLGVLGGVAWGKAALVLVGAVLLVLALGRAAAMTRARRRSQSGE